MTDIPSRTIAVYGALRSGTTLLRLMLDGHPRLACPGETDFLFDHLIRDGDGGRYDPEVMERDRIYRAHMAKYADQPLSAHTPDGFIARIAGEDQIAVLMLHRHIDRVLDLYPDMRLIHMLRDPRDVARSSIGMGWAGNVYHGVDHWIDTERGWQAVRDRLHPDQVLEIRYERLIQDTEAVLQQVCAFCGLSFDPQMLAYDAKSTYSKPDTSLVEQWKRMQTPREIGLVECRIGALLTETGYAPSGHPAPPPGRLERLALAVQNRRAIWARRIERFGLLDPLVVAIANRLGLPGLGEGRSGAWMTSWSGI